MRAGHLSCQDRHMVVRLQLGEGQIVQMVHYPCLDLVYRDLKRASAEFSRSVQARIALLPKRTLRCGMSPERI